MPSGCGRITRLLTLQDEPIATAEFLVVDTETNGLARRRLRADRGRRGARRRRRAARPLGARCVARARAAARAASSASPGSRRRWSTSAPPAEAVLPELAAQLRGPRARRPQRVVRPPRAAPGVRARRARLARPAGAVHGRAGAPAAARSQRQRRLRGARRRRSAIEVEVVPPRAAPTPRPARACSARCSRGCARTRRRSATRSRCCAPRARAGARAPTDARRRARPRRGARLPALDFAQLPDDPGVYLFRDAAGQALYVGKSVACARRARAHFAPSAPDGRLDRAGRDRRLPRARTPSSARCVLENRLIKALRPPGNVRLQARRPATSTCAAASTSRSRSSRSRPSRPPGHAVSVGPLRGARAGGRARRAAQLAVRAAPLRAQAAAARAPVGLRADGPLPVAVPGRPGPEPLPPPARRGARAVRRRGRRRRRAARPRRRRRCGRAAAQQPSSARRGCGAARERLRVRCSTASAACSRPRTRGRGSCWPRTRAAGASTRSGWWAGAWSTGGRAARTLDELARAHARRRCARGGAARAAGRICRPTRSTRCGSSPTWLASHPDTPQLVLDPAPGGRGPRRVRDATRGWPRLPASAAKLGRAGERELDDLALAPPSPTATVAPGWRLAAHERQRDRPEARGRARRCRAARRPARRGASSSPGWQRRRSAAARADGGSACRGSAGARRSPGRRSSPW